MKRNVPLNGNKKSELFNGETINYLIISCLAPVFYLMCAFVFSFLNDKISTVICGVITAVVLYFAYDKLVFVHSKVKTAIKILYFALLSLFDATMIYAGIALIGKTGDSPVDFSVACVLLVLFFINYAIMAGLIFRSRTPPESRQNGRIFLLFMRNRFVFLSAVISGAILLFVFFCYGAYPFGTNTVLRMDLYHQYGPLLAELYDRITDLGSFTYSWQTGGGGAFIGNLFNYLSSPINFVILLFERSQLPYAISIIVLIKAMLSAASFTLYLKMSRRSHSFATAGFGILYAFCGYFLAYYWNIMWLDALYLLPLIVWGIELIIEKRSVKMYMAALVLAMVSNYYMAFILCIFSVLYFLVYYFSNYNFSSRCAIYLSNQGGKLKRLANNRFLSSGVMFAGASIVCALICAAALMPTYFALKNCSATSGTFPTDVNTYFTLFDFLQNHFGALDPTIRSSGGDVLPNIFSGTIIFILIPLYYLNSDIKLREKICNTFLLLFFVVSFNTNVMNYIWHGFHFPNDLPYRFSFLYTFVLLSISFTSLMHLKAIKAKDIMFVGMGAVLIAVLCEKMPNKYIKDDFTIYAAIIFILVYVTLLTLVKKKALGKVALSLLMLICIVTETIVCSTDSYSMGQDLKNYAGDYNAFRSVFDRIDDGEKDNEDFCRVEKTWLRTRMDPSWYGYNGLSTFSSMAYENLSELQLHMGMYGNKINSYTYNAQTPIYNSMFALKYLVDNNTNFNASDAYYSKLFDDGNSASTAYRYDYNLPIAFCVDKNIKNWNTSDPNPFRVQNDFASKAGRVDDVLQAVSVSNTQVNNLDSINVSGNGSFSFQKSNVDSKGTVTLTLDVINDGNIYLYISSASSKNAVVRKGGDDLNYDYNSEAYIFDVGYCKKGESLSVEIDVGDNAADSIQFYAYYCDKDVFTEMYNNFANYALDMTEWNDTDFTGAVQAGENQILYTSIPYDKGWSVYVDGQKVHTFTIGNALLGIDISEGTHEIRFKFIPQGLAPGIAVSTLAVGGTVCFFIAEALFKRKRASK